MCYILVMKLSGFTLLELLIVIVVLGVLGAVIIPSFVDLEPETRQTMIFKVGGVMRTSIHLAQMKARAMGMEPAASNPAGGGGGGGAQAAFIIEIAAGSAELDWRNLCPESRAELGDRLTMLDYISIDPATTKFQTRVTNQSTWVGYELPPGQCYVVYDSFACTVTEVTNGC